MLTLEEAQTVLTQKCAQRAKMAVVEEAQVLTLADPVLPSALSLKQHLTMHDTNLSH